MLLDAIGIIFILLFFFRGYSRGLIISLFSVVAILLGAICALKLSHIFAAYLLQKHIVTSGWAQLVSYVLLFIGVVMLVRLIARSLESLLKVMMLGLLNKLAGGLLYAFLGAVIWSSLLWIANQMHLISPETIAASKTYPELSKLAPWVCSYVGKLLPFAKNIFAELQHFFDQVNQQLPEHVGTH